MKTTTLKNKKNTDSLILFCFLVILLSIISCKKRQDIQPELPPITQEGKNTFGCMFGNEFWLPGNFIIFGYPNLSIRYTPEKTIIIRSNRKNPVNNAWDNLFVGYDDIVLEEGEYILKEENSRITIRVRGDGKSYFLYNEGKLTITRLDTENQIISGTFYFNVKEETTGEIVEVSNGRFDVVYKNY